MTIRRRRRRRRGRRRIDLQRPQRTADDDRMWEEVRQSNHLVS